MSFYIGQLLLTGALLNRTAAPIILKHYRFFNELSFEVTGRTITAKVSGRYTLIGFKGSFTAHLLEFYGSPPLYRAVLELSVNLLPRILNPLIESLLEKNLAGRPGISWTENRLELALDKLPFITAAVEKLGGAAVLSELRLALDPPGCNEGMLFNLYLNDLS